MNIILYFKPLVVVILSNLMWRGIYDQFPLLIDSHYYFVKHKKIIFTFGYGKSVLI